MPTWIKTIIAVSFLTLCFILYIQIVVKGADLFTGKLSDEIAKNSEEEFHYSVSSYRYLEKGGTLFTPKRQYVKVTYETDSDSEKRSFPISSIEIGKKTEVVVYHSDSFGDMFNLYMTAEDYESLFK